MKPARTWLPVAVRAHELRKLEDQRRVRDAWEALLDAAERERSTGRRLDELAAAWAAQRGMGRLAPALETLYGCFHTHLHRQSDLATRQQSDCRELWESTQAELRRSHATQRLLERFAQEIEAARRRELCAREAQSRVEAWLLGQLGLGAAEPVARPSAVDSGDCNRPVIHSPGGADDSRAS